MNSVERVKEICQRAKNPNDLKLQRDLGYANGYTWSECKKGSIFLQMQIY
ncbi:hypothetical protein [[Ruminococcus] torques]